MARHRRIRSAFWLFLLLLGLGAGWAAYQQWPRLALFERASEPREQEADREVAVEQSAEQQPARDEAPAGDVAEGSGQATEPPPDAPPTGAEATARPSFDIVRVERDGRAVIAGRAAPGAEVEVRAGGQVIDRVRASRRGEWVATPAKPLAPGAQELSA